MMLGKWYKRLWGALGSGCVGKTYRETGRARDGRDDQNALDVAEGVLGWVDLNEVTPFLLVEEILGWLP
jgi:hypothetical protein